MLFWASEIKLFPSLSLFRSPQVPPKNVFTLAACGKVKLDPCGGVGGKSPKNWDSFVIFRDKRLGAIFDSFYAFAKRQKYLTYSFMLLNFNFGEWLGRVKKEKISAIYSTLSLPIRIRV